MQLETIHPYLDGNGRIGRLLTTLLLEHWKLLNKPLLYLSLYFKRHRNEYYQRLSAVRVDGDWEGWIHYFLKAVATIAAGRAIELLAAADVLVEITGKRRDRSFAYQRFLDRLRVGTELDTPPSRSERHAPTRSKS